MKSSIVWIGIVVALLLFSVGTQVTLMVAAVHDPSFAVEPDYEERARNWDAVQAQRARNEALGWTVDLSTAPGERPRTVDVELLVFGAYGKPLREARVRVATFHNARAAHVIEADLPGNGEGVYRATLPMTMSGVWEFRVEVLDGEDLYTETVRKSVLSRPRGVS